MGKGRLVRPVQRSVARAAFGLVFFALAPLAMGAKLVDDFEDGNQTNALGSAWYSYADAKSTVRPTAGFTSIAGHASVGAASFGYTLGASIYDGGFAGLMTNLGTTSAPFDASAYAGVRFWAKGHGIFALEIPIVATTANNNNFGIGFPVWLGSDWQHIELPFDQLRQPMGGTPQTFDASTVLSLVWFSSGLPNDASEIDLDDVEFFAASEAINPPQVNPIVTLPKVDQVGYLPDAAKLFSIVASTSIAAGTPFEIRNASGGAVAAGTLGQTLFDETAVAGEQVLRGDFSSLQTPGTYQVSVGAQVSAPFSVATDVYRSLYRDAARTFYLIRSGVAINDAETGIAHAASHTADALLADQPGVQRDLTGGWYNAGDVGKWTHMAAQSSTFMMLLHELRGSTVSGIDLGIPESTNAVPDLLDQARWGLEWLLKMQSPDGSVYHKVDSEYGGTQHFCFGYTPDRDPWTRYASDTSSIDAGNFVAVMLQASRVFANVDASFASKCRQASDSAWTWLQANPNIAQADPAYPDSSTVEENLWALAERAATTGGADLMTRAQEGIAAQTWLDLGLMTPEIFGYFSLARLSGVPNDVAALAKQQIVNMATSLLAFAANGYGVALTGTDYIWESNEKVWDHAAIFIFAWELTRDPRFRNAALAQLDYTLGVNSLNRSFVVGHGQNTTQHPYHWAYASLGKALPGWASGGANGTLSAGIDSALAAMQRRGTPPAKCFLDMGAPGGSWASNEGETAEIAALAFVAGYFTSPPPLSTGVDAGADGSVARDGTSDAGAPDASIIDAPVKSDSGSQSVDVASDGAGDAAGIGGVTGSGDAGTDGRAGTGGAVGSGDAGTGGRAGTGGAVGSGDAGTGGRAGSGGSVGSGGAGTNGVAGTGGSVGSGGTGTGGRVSTGGPAGGGGAGTGGVASSGGAAGGSGTAPTQGGCGCHTGGSDAHPGATASLVLLLVVGGRLRRRNSRGP